jgi:hypothetical protein
MRHTTDQGLRTTTAQRKGHTVGSIFTMIGNGGGHQDCRDEQLHRFMPSIVLIWMK